MPLQLANAVGTERVCVGLWFGGQHYFKLLPLRRLLLPSTVLAVQPVQLQPFLRELPADARGV